MCLQNKHCLERNAERLDKHTLSFSFLQWKMIWIFERLNNSRGEPTVPCERWWYCVCIVLSLMWETRWQYRVEYGHSVESDCWLFSLQQCMWVKNITLAGPLSDDPAKLVSQMKGELCTLIDVQWKAQKNMVSSCCQLCGSLIMKTNCEDVLGQRMQPPLE